MRRDSSEGTGKAVQLSLVLLIANGDLLPAKGVLDPCLISAPQAVVPVSVRVARRSHHARASEGRQRFAAVTVAHAPTSRPPSTSAIVVAPPTRAGGGRRYGPARKPGGSTTSTTPSLELVPLLLAAHGASVGQVGAVAGTYPAVWGAGQIFTGHWSDRVGRKPLIVAGMLLQAAALGLLALCD
jgi:hypothetical protein